MQEQVKLPIKIAMSVTLQGLKIRLGRSVVTLLGVVSGIAFLMSIFTGLVIKEGVKSEEQLLQNVDRMYNILVAEMGNPHEKVMAILQAGPLNNAELGFLKKLQKEKVSALKVYTANNESVIPPLSVVQKSSLSQLGEGANALIVMGQGSVGSIDWQSVFQRTRHPLAAQTREYTNVNFGNGITVANLTAILTKEDMIKLEEKKTETKFRNIWILTISLFVTIIGISNSMLMSVTERFREIGTMKCLGALSGFIRNIFLLESSIIGVIGSIGGVLVGMLFSYVIYGVSYNFALVTFSINYLYLSLSIIGCTIIGTLLAILAAIYPAVLASNMVPSHALRSNI